MGSDGGDPAECSLQRHSQVAGEVSLQRGFYAYRSHRRSARAGSHCPCWWATLACVIAMSAMRALATHDRLQPSTGGSILSKLLADNGVLKDLQWNDVSCGACGGRKSNRCLTAKSSDATQYSCTGWNLHGFMTFDLHLSDEHSASAEASADGVSPAVQSNCTASGNLTDPCLPSVYLGFSGDDVHQRTFQSGYQITKINQFSLVAFYQRASAVVCSASGCPVCYSIRSYHLWHTCAKGLNIVLWSVQLSGIYDTIASGGLGGSGVNDGGIGQGGFDSGGDEPAAR